MNMLNKTLIRESFDCDTYEKERMVYVGKLLSFENNLYKFSFKVDESIMRLEMKFDHDKCFIKQFYPSSKCEFTLSLNKKEKYFLELNNSYKLFFITEASLIKHDDLQIKLKYNLFDENSKRVISFNEITIIGDDEVC